MSETTMTNPTSIIDGADTIFVIGTAIFTSLLSEGKNNFSYRFKAHSFSS